MTENMMTDQPAPWLAERAEIRKLLQEATTRLASIAVRLSAGIGWSEAVRNDLARARLDVEHALRMLDRDAPGWHQPEGD